LSSYFATLGQENPTTTNTSIILPLTVVEVTICVIVNTGGVPGVVLEVAFVVFAILEKNLDLAIKQLVAVETALNYFARQSEEKTVTLRAAIAPFTFVNCSGSSEFA